MNRKDVDTFEKLNLQLISVHEEISLLSKKKPDDAINKFKLRFVNKLITVSNGFLTDKYRPFDDFTIFEEDDVPQYSDVVFILSQYLQCFEKLRADNVFPRAGNWYWTVNGEINDDVDAKGFVYIRSIQPKKLKD